MLHFKELPVPQRTWKRRWLLKKGMPGEPLGKLWKDSWEIRRVTSTNYWSVICSNTSKNWAAECRWNFIICLHIYIGFRKTLVTLASNRANASTRICKQWRKGTKERGIQQWWEITFGFWLETIAHNIKDHLVQTFTFDCSHMTLQSTVMIFLSV